MALDRIGAAVVGGGVVGCAVLFELACAGFEDLFLFEKLPTLGDAQSGRNSGVVHAGIYYATGSLKAELCVEVDGSLVDVVGAHLTPTFEPKPGGSASVGDMVTVGPEFSPVTDREDYEKGRKEASFFLERASRFFPGLALEDLEPDFTGIMANRSGGTDFVIRPVAGRPRAVQLVGIDSPGLTSSLAIARRVREMLH